MKLVTLFKKSRKMAPEYVPGRCNIGARGRAIRLATGVGIIALFVAVDVLVLGPVFAPFRLLLAIPFYIGPPGSPRGNDVVLCPSRLQGHLRPPRAIRYGLWQV